MSNTATNLLGMSRDSLEAFFTDMGEKPFRARQLMRWLYQNSILDPSEMTDLSLSLREALADRAAFDLPEVRELKASEDGTLKWLLAAGNTQGIETVFIPEASRGTLCISSQVGCAMDCSFCATGLQGFNRNLTVAEIIGQVALATRELKERGDERGISNIVFMGMGEPLANMRELLPAIEVLTDDLGYGLSRRRVTVSTSGIVPQMLRLAEEANVALAVSLHAANDRLRDELVPINRIHPIAELLDACWVYAEKANLRDVTFEYIMLDGINDSINDARDLARQLRRKPAKVNLIPYNPVEGIAYRRSPRERIDAFRQVLLDAGIMTVTRKTRGDDIDAACGQLAGRVKNRVRNRLGQRNSTVTH